MPTRKLFTMLDKGVFRCYIVSMNEMSQVSCEEFFTEDMGPADWANEPVEAKPLTWREAKMGGWSPEELEERANNWSLTNLRLGRK